MAANATQSDLVDHDLETDDYFESHGDAGFVNKFQEQFKRGNPDKHNTDGRTSDRIDSGFASGSLSGSLPSSSSGKHSLLEADKSPIQCSDAAENVSSIEEKLSELNVSDEVDEAICSMQSLRLGACSDDVSLPSLGASSGGESVVTQASDEQPDEIYIDLNEQDEDGDTVLHVAIVSLLWESALVLIDLCDELDPDELDSLNIQNHLRQSALHLAVLTDQPEIVRALVAKGVNVMLRDQQGNTPLHIACRMGNTDAVSAIVKCLTDLNLRQKYFAVRNNEGLTSMHLAVLAKEYIILGHLLAKGADVNIGDAKSGRTMLHYAVERRDLESVTLLLTHKDIDIDCRTFKGESPVVLAFWRNYQDIVKKLRSNGAYFDYSMVEDSDDEYAS